MATLEMSYQQMRAAQQAWANEHNASECPSCGDSGSTWKRDYCEGQPVDTRVPCLCPLAEYEMEMTWQDIKAHFYQSLFVEA